jgi:hypothetical protein
MAREGYLTLDSDPDMMEPDEALTRDPLQQVSGRIDLSR